MLFSRRKLLKAAPTPLVFAGLGSLAFLETGQSQDLGRVECTGIALYGGEAYVYLSSQKVAATLSLPNGSGIFQARGVYKVTCTRVS